MRAVESYRNIYKLPCFIGGMAKTKCIHEQLKMFYQDKGKWISTNISICRICKRLFEINTEVKEL